MHPTPRPVSPNDGRPGDVRLIQIAPFEEIAVEQTGYDPVAAPTVQRTPDIARMPERQMPTMRTRIADNTVHKLPDLPFRDHHNSFDIHTSTGLSLIFCKLYHKNELLTIPKSVFFILKSVIFSIDFW